MIDPSLSTPFLVASAVPVDAPHRSGTLDAARALLASQPALAEHSVYAAAVTGNAAAVRQWLQYDATLATTSGGPHHWDPLTWCCFSRWLRDDPSRQAEFVEVARVLLEAGAPANTGFVDHTHGETPQRESALYGAAGVAFCAPLTALLLAHAADPNDEEVPYHAAEEYAHEVVAALLAAPVPLTRDSLATMLLRAADWHDDTGVRLLLQHGVHPDHPGRWPHSPFLQAVRRDNEARIVERMLDADADPLRRFGDANALETAAWHGRTDLLQQFAVRGVPLPEDGLAAVAVDATLGDLHAVRARLSRDAMVREAFLARAAAFACRAAGNGMLAPLGVLLQLLPTVDVRWGEGDGYWDIAPHSTPLHVAAWRAQHAVVQQLIEAGADVHARDGRGRTPLQRAVAACVASFWMNRRQPTSVRALLEAGASAEGIALPTGYDAIDALFERGGMG